MKRAISYARVSTSAQGRSGFGIQAQQTQIDAFARERGYRIEKRFSDVHTGMGEASINDRVDLRKAIDLARKTGWPIIIADYDRLGRNARSMLELLKDPTITVISASHGEDADRAIVIAEAERAEREGREISVRTKAKLWILKEQGIRLGNPSIGEAQRKSAVARAEKADKHIREIAPLVQKLRTSGMTAKAIAERLNQEGYRTSRGLPWNQGNIQRALKRIDAMKTAAERPSPYVDNPQFGAF